MVYSHFDMLAFKKQHYRATIAGEILGEKNAIRNCPFKVVISDFLVVDTLAP